MSASCHANGTARGTYGSLLSIFRVKSVIFDSTLYVNIAFWLFCAR